MPGDDLGLIAAAAREAGGVAMRYFRKPLAAREKPGGQGPVTEADIAVNAALAARLRAARPDYGWLSEEDADAPARLEAAATFIVDPIDGTRAFMAGEPGFAVSVAVARDGRPVAGAVYLPAQDVLYAAEAGGPATRNGAAIAASSRADPAGARLLASAAALAPAHWDGAPPAVTRAFRPSIAARLCCVAEGRHDGMLTLADTWEWDVAAGALIADRAGAAVTDRTGAPLRLNAQRPQVRGLLAAPPALHAALIRRLRP